MQAGTTTGRFATGAIAVKFLQYPLLTLLHSGDVEVCCRQRNGSELLLALMLLMPVSLVVQASTTRGWASNSNKAVLCVRSGKSCTFTADHESLRSKLAQVYV